MQICLIVVKDRGIRHKYDLSQEEKPLGMRYNVLFSQYKYLFGPVFFVILNLDFEKTASSNFCLIL